MSYDLFIVDKDLPEPEWFDVCELDGEHGRDRRSWPLFQLHV